MQSITYSCKRCFNYSSQYATQINSRHLTLGQNYSTSYWLYLFIPLDYLSTSSTIVKAELLFYTIPRTFYRSPEHFNYSLYPASQYINPFFPYAQYSLTSLIEPLNFHPPVGSDIYSFDLTSLVRKWCDGSITNYGFLLTLDTPNVLQQFAGPTFPGLEPMLTISFHQYQQPILPCHDDAISLPSVVKVIPQNQSI